MTFSNVSCSASKVFTIVFVPCLIVISGCSKPSQAPEEKAKPRIAGIVFQEDQFFRLVQYGMKGAAAQYGVDLLLENSSNSPDKEISLVDTYIAGKVNAIVISPLSETGSVTALQRAYDSGIKVITYNTFIKADFPGSVIESDQTDLGASTGRAAAKYIVGKLDGKATIAMVEFISLGLESAHQRVNGFRNEITKVPGVKIVAEQDAWLAPEAATVVENILTAHPDVNVIWAANEGGTVGAVTGVRNSGKGGRVAVFGTDMSEQLADFLLAEDGVLRAVTGQKPFEIGFMAVETAVKVVGGTPVEKKVALPGVLFERDRPDEIKAYKQRLLELTK
jgi:ABC-type sugar transport system substrate-binding protein